MTEVTAEGRLSAKIVVEVPEEHRWITDYYGTPIQVQTVVSHHFDVIVRQDYNNTNQLHGPRVRKDGTPGVRSQAAGYVSDQALPTVVREAIYTKLGDLLSAAVVEHLGVVEVENAAAPEQSSSAAWGVR